MRTCFAEWSWLLLSFLSIACARPQYMARKFPPRSDCRKSLTFVPALQGVQTGPYHIYNCDDHTYQLSGILDTLLSTLERVLDDVSQSRASGAYATFFGDIAFAPMVRDILSNITAGTPIAPGPHAIPNASPASFGPPVTPQFVCITNYDQMTWPVTRGGKGGPQGDAYSACLSTFAHIYSVFGAKLLNNTIVLCPLFFTYPDIPLPLTSSCLPVDTHRNRFENSGEDMLDYQLWKILIELVHGYIYARAGYLVNIQDINDCAKVATRNAVNSATNYAFYAASEQIFRYRSRSPFLYLISVIPHLFCRANEWFLDIQLNCTDFPRSLSHSFSVSVPELRGSTELLEIDANTTLSGGSRQSIANNLTGTTLEDPNAVTLTPSPS